VDELRKRRDELDEAMEKEPDRDKKEALARDMEPIVNALDPIEAKLNGLRQEWAAGSVLGRVGYAVEPVVRPLGWDWRIGVAAIASFPAREVMVGTLGLIFSQGKGASDDKKYREGLSTQLRGERWQDDPSRPLFTVPVAISVLVFFALCCQCASTLAVIRRETKTWRWPAFTFVYMTALAYVGALLAYQVGSLF
jgi:ferrous iron transport protein B